MGGREGGGGRERERESREAIIPVVLLTLYLALNVKYFGKALSLKNRNVTRRIPFSFSIDV